MSTERRDGVRRAWVLNLDAEHELEAARSYAPTDHLRGIVARESRRLIGTLVGPDDVVLTEEDVRAGNAVARAARGLEGRAWSMTARARRILEAAGALPIRAPAMDVLRTVNARAFAARIRAPLAADGFEKHVVATIDDALARLACPATDGWLVRRTFGAAGRGRRRIARGAPDAGERAWLDASLRTGPLVIEPWVRVVREHTRSAWLDPDGRLTISAPCFQAVNEHGAWVETQRSEIELLSRADDERLEATVSAVGAELHAAGYFGPFGIDAYRHRVPGSNATVLNPLSEINARFTMDWATAMAHAPELGEARARLDAFVEESARAALRLGDQGVQTNVSAFDVFQSPPAGAAQNTGSVSR